jgi:hypothetical protein
MAEMGTGVKFPVVEYLLFFNISRVNGGENDHFCFCYSDFCSWIGQVGVQKIQL